MSKTLFILRHAKSDWSQPKLADIDRPLNSRGVRDASLVGDWLNRFCIDKQIESLHALVSPATRAVTTHEILTTCLQQAQTNFTIVEGLYLADCDELLESIRHCGLEGDVLMLVGHNPGMHELVEQLASCTLTKFPTCAIACIKFDVTAWDQVSSASCVSNQLTRPKKLRP